jgi:hypothetical protein
MVLYLDVLIARLAVLHLRILIDNNDITGFKYQFTYKVSKNLFVRPKNSRCIPPKLGRDLIRLSTLKNARFGRDDELSLPGGTF